MLATLRTGKAKDEKGKHVIDYLFSYSSVLRVMF